MKFDDHEIWGAPVRVPDESAPDAPNATSAPGPEAAVRSGRLYRSAGSDPHPEAILALPQHRRTASAASTPLVADTADPEAPISISSLIPRPAVNADPAIAEVLGGPSAPSEPAHGFTSWFKHSGVHAAEETHAEPSAAVLSARRAVSIEVNARTMFLGLFLVTAVVGVVDAVVRGAVGLPTGLALVAAGAVGSWRIEREHRWAAWVMPSYALIAAILVAGQFTAGSPGASPLGQVLLIGTTLISLAPWLALATVLGIALPLLRRPG